MISAGIETGGIGPYNIIESIGQGGFSEVFRAMNSQTGELVAIKQIKSTSSPDQQSRSKEILIHKHLQHGNIIKFIESFVEEKEGLVFIVQELADGGELFEHVEPDTGFSEQVAHFYFVQMIRAIKYLHRIGVCHRDLKLENLLLDGQGNLKIADFGLSTVFTKKGIRRRLSSRCGTPAYMAPEVTQSKEYEGDHCDIWSCGIVLIMLLTGNLPWESSNKKSCWEYGTYVKEGTNKIINLLPEGPKRIVQGILKHENNKERWDIDMIMKDPWFTQENVLFDLKFMCANPKLLHQLFRSHTTHTQLSSYSVTLALTQPDLQIINRTASNPLEFAGFSQPHCSGSSVKSRAEASESTTTIFARNSFARFLCKCNGSDSEAEDTVSSRFQETLQNMLVQYQQSPNKLCFNFQTVDRRKCPLVGSISLQKISNETTENDTTVTFVIVIFKKNRGNPVEFIRFFKYIATQFSDLMMIDSPDS